MPTTQPITTPAEFRTHADAFTKAYVEAMFWSSTAGVWRCDKCRAYIATPDDAEDTEGIMRKWCPTCESEVWESDASFSDAQFDIEDLAPATIARIVSDCAKFQAENGHLLTDDACKLTGGCTVDEQAGHDFWLTRAGHGAGFWDGDWEEPTATKLTRASEAFGELDAYIGDDGKIYF